MAEARGQEGAGLGASSGRGRPEPLGVGAPAAQSQGTGQSPGLSAPREARWSQGWEQDSRLAAGAGGLRLLPHTRVTMALCPGRSLSLPEPGV